MHLEPGPGPRALASGGWWRPIAPAAAADAEALAEVRSGGRAPVTSLAFGAMVAFTFVLLLAPQEHFPWLAPLHLAVLATAAAILAHLRDRLRRGGPILAGGPTPLLAIGLGGWALATVPFSLWPGGSAELLFAQYLKSIVIFLLLSAVLDSAAKLRTMAWALTCFAVPLAVTALLNFAGHKFVGGEQAVERIVGYQAPLTENPNDLALLLNLILPLTAALFFTHKGLPGRALLGAAIALDAGAVVATFSRAGFLTLAVIFAGLLWKLRKRPERVWIWGALGVAVLCVALLPGGYLSHLGTITSIDSDTTGSSQERSRDMLVALGQIFERPLAGAGLGMNVLALNAVRGATWRSVHNVYLQYAVDLGLPGLSLFLLLFWRCARGLGRALAGLRRRGGSRELVFLAEGIQLSLLGYAVAAFFHPNGYNFPFFFFAGLAVAARGVTLQRVHANQR